MTQHAEKAKKFLEGYKTAYYKLIEAKERIIKYREQMLRSPSISGMPHGTDKHDLADYVAGLEKIIRDNERIEAEQREIMRAVRESIDRLCSERDRRILSYRYIDFMTFEQIAETMDISMNAVYIRHKKILERVQYH